MWIPTTRRQHSRAGLRYETDLTDGEWAVIAPLLPEPASCGRPPVWTMRDIWNAIFYVLRGGIAWRMAGIAGGNVTVSIGSASDVSRAEKLHARADSALYQAKAGGRNRTRSVSAELPERIGDWHLRAVGS